jgi:hypothetical protein
MGGANPTLSYSKPTLARGEKLGEELKEVKKE